MNKPAAQNILSILNRFPGLLQISHMAADAVGLDGFSQISSVKTAMSGIQQNMDGILESLKEHDSFLNRIARFWGETSIWLKIGIGTVVFGPLVAIGVLAAMIDLIVLSVLGALLYIGCSLVLDNHHYMNLLNESFRKGISSLGGLLQTTIGALDDIDANLRVDLECLKEQNASLTQKLTEFKVQLDDLRKQLLDLEKIKEKLSETEEKLNQTMEESASVNLSLAAKVSQFDELQRSMTLMIQTLEKKAETKIETLGAAVAKMYAMDDDRRASFLSHIDEFITTYLDLSSEQLRKAQTELVGVRLALEQSNQRYEHLLDRHLSQVQRLEQLLEPVDLQSQGRERFSMFAMNKSNQDHIIPIQMVVTP